MTRKKTRKKRTTRPDHSRTLLLGRILGGAYQLLEEIDSSEKVRVFKAMQITDEKPVILKILQPRWLWDRILVTRYTREVQAVAGLKHPSLVQVLDVNYEDGIFYVATEYVEGDDLFSMLHRGIKPSLADALDIVTQLARLLNFAVRKGIRYRTIKSSNILLNSAGRIKVLTFNTPRSVLSRNITGLKPNVGEDPDVFFLGVTLYQLLTGKFPLERSDAIITDLAMARLLKISTDWSLQEVETLDSSDKSELERIIHRAVTFDIKARYPGINDLLHDLNRFSAKRSRAGRESADMNSASGVLDAIMGELADGGRHAEQRAWGPADGRHAEQRVSDDSLEHTLQRELDEDSSRFWKKKYESYGPPAGPVGGSAEEEHSRWSTISAVLAAAAALTAMMMLLW